MMSWRFRRVVATYGEVIRSRSYFPLWLGQLISSFGDTLHYVALVVLVLPITQDIPPPPIVVGTALHSACSRDWRPADDGSWRWTGR